MIDSYAGDAFSAVASAERVRVRASENAQHDRVEGDQARHDPEQLQLRSAQPHGHAQRSMRMWVQEKWFSCADAGSCER